MAEGEAKRSRSLGKIHIEREIPAENDCPARWDRIDAVDLADVAKAVKYLADPRVDEGVYRIIRVARGVVEVQRVETMSVEDGEA